MAAKHRPYPDFIPNSILGYTKEGQDQMYHDQQVWREEELLIRQQEQLEWLQERERKNQIQKEIDRKSDRKFMSKLSIWAAVISAVVASVLTVILERLFLK